MSSIKNNIDVPVPDILIQMNLFNYEPERTQAGRFSRRAVTQRAQLGTSIDGTCLSTMGWHMSWLFALRPERREELEGRGARPPLRTPTTVTINCGGKAGAEDTRPHPVPP